MSYTKKQVLDILNLILADANNKKWPYWHGLNSKIHKCVIKNVPYDYEFLELRHYFIDQKTGYNYIIDSSNNATVFTCKILHNKYGKRCIITIYCNIEVEGNGKIFTSITEIKD